ncbi:MAG TPA: hypothetical protein VE549_16800 [Myxococcaceae bacterium]|nr:hypothetical protein [Myxococcaceae bacterium]
MKRLLAAVMILSAPAAFAVDASEVGPKLKETARNIAETAQKATESAKKSVHNWRQRGRVASDDTRTYQPGEAFQLKGTIQDAGRREITIVRPGLPPASLDIRDKTKVTIDGKPAKPSELKEGDEVRARFQLEGEEIVAVSINAKSRSASATGGAGAAGGSEKKPETADKAPRGK